MIGNTRIAIRDSTDSFNIGFFDNEAGIKYNDADLNRFLAGSASILTLRYYSKDIDTIRTGCKLSFFYKGKDYWLNILDIKKTGFNVELTAFSTNLEANNELVSPYKATVAETIASYIKRFDAEKSFVIGTNEVPDKTIKLEWTGKETVLARLYSVANNFDAELEFVTELNDDYSLKRHVLNIYKKGNVGSVINSPVRVGKDLKVINYEESIKELYTAVRGKGTDGLTIAGLNEKVYDEKGNLIYYSNSDTVYAPQARDRYPSIGKQTDDGYTLMLLDDSEYSTKEDQYAYMLGRIKDVSQPKVTFTAEGGFAGEIGDTRILIDDIHYEPELYVQARIIETVESILTEQTSKTVFSNFERKYSQLSDDLLKRAEELAKEVMPYTLELATNNGTVFKNGAGNSQITPNLKRGSETISGASFVWTINGTSTTASTYTVTADAVSGTAVVKVEAVLAGKAVASTEITFTNVADGRDGTDGIAGKDGVGLKSTAITYVGSTSGTVAPASGWTSTIPIISQGQYLWTRTVWTYTDNSTETGYSVAKMGEAGANAYFYVAYADSPNGSTGFNLTDASKRYMGHYSSSNSTQSTSAASYKWIDRANVTATFVQSTAPTNPPTGSRWKYTGSTVITANSSTINPGEQYLFIGARWVKDVITSDNLKINDQFINGPMIKNGAVTVDKLSVGDLSAISANLGSVNAGKMLLQRSFSAGSSAVPAYNYPAFKSGLFVDNYGLIVNGSPVQKITTEVTATGMPVVAVTSGEIRFLRANLTDNIEEVLHTGLSDPDFGYIQFGRDSYGKNALIIEANGQVYLKGQNYTDWSVSTVNRNVRWRVQGNLVIVDYDVTFSSSGNQAIVIVPTTYVPKALMLMVKAWKVDNTKDRNAQLNAEGDLHILGAEANQRYCGQIVWAY